MRALALGIVASAADIKPWDISSASFVQDFSIAVQDTNPTALSFSPDGAKMYVIGFLNDNVNEYDLSTPWNVTTASFNQSFSVATQDVIPRGLFFKPDGAKMFVLGENTNNILEYDLSTPWNISTASLSQSFGIGAQDPIGIGLFFRQDDGEKMYVTGANNDSVYEYNLTTGWDVSTASFLQSLSVVAQEAQARDLFFKPDGKRMYLAGTDGDDITEYVLSTAWDVTSASANQTFSIAAQDTAPSGLFFRPDGRKLYFVGSLNDRVYEYDVI